VKKMVDYTAANLQTINNYAGLTNSAIELLVDAMISHINVETGASIAHFRDDTVNADGSKVVSITEAQEPAFLAGAALMLRAFNDKGPNVSISGQSVSQVLQDPHYAVWNRVFRQALSRLRGRSFVTT
jgi:hypothetical protein